MDGWMDAGHLFSAAASIIDSQRVAAASAATAAAGPASDAIA